MTRLPSLNGEQIVKALGKAKGFKCSGRKAAIFISSTPMDGLRLVPVHKGESVGRGLLRKIIQDADLGREEFLKLL